jgi:hypothetical protein
MSKAFTEPTVENVKSACAIFDTWKDNPDPALTELFTRYPKNTDFVHVMLKVVTLNTLYSTMIRVYSDHPTVYDVARHIVDLNIDTELDLHSVDLVYKIANTEEIAKRLGKKKQLNYSFATKYCNWHRQDFYPIWDSRVDEYLWQLRNREKDKENGFREFKHEELWRYPEFKMVMDDFKAHFRLEDISFKMIDKFLFVEGGKLFAAKEKEKQLATTTEPQQSLPD